MFEVKVTVDLPGIPGALNNLARAIAESGFVKPVTPAAAKVETEVPAIVTTPAIPTSAPAPAPVEQSATVQPPVAPAEQPTPVQASATPIPDTPAEPQETFTMNALSMAGAKLVEEGKMDMVVTLLKRFGAVAITQLKEEQYADFAKSLRALGTSI